MNNPKKILEDLIKIDSRVSRSNVEIVNYIAEKFPTEQVTSQTFNKGALKLHNLIIRIPGVNSDSPLVLAGHTDTVNPSDEWKLPPFEPCHGDGKIFGLGASDMKSGLACMIGAALSLTEKPSQDVYLLFDADEEGSGLGGRKLIEKLELKNARVIAAEPTDQSIIYAQKGSLDMKITLDGTSLHSSRTSLENNLRNNAIYKAIKVCNSLISYQKEIEQKENTLLGRPNLNIGVMAGGTGANVVAPHCVIEICRRLIPEEDIKEVYQEVSSVIISQASDAQIEILFEGKPFQTDKNGKFMKQLLALAKGYIPDLKLDIKHGWTEAELFSRYGEAVIFGPGISAASHQADEYAPIGDLTLFTKIYHKLMIS
ncbi:MAG: M20 family metallopeptidase [archaeon]